MPDRVVSIATMTQEEEMKLRLYTESQQDGGNPSQFLELLAYVVENQIWERLELPSGEPMTFRKLIEMPFPDGIGSTPDNILTTIKLQHKHESHPSPVRERMDAMRQEVTRLLHEALPDHGGDRIEQGYNITLPEENERGTSQSYTLRRLRRDRPDLADKVIEKELSANAAAIEAGFRERTISISLDPAKAATCLARHFDVPALISALKAQR